MVSAELSRVRSGGAQRDGVHNLSHYSMPNSTLRARATPSQKGSVRRDAHPSSSLSPSGDFRRAQPCSKGWTRSALLTVPSTLPRPRLTGSRSYHSLHSRSRNSDYDWWATPERRALLRTLRPDRIERGHVACASFVVQYLTAARVARLVGHPPLARRWQDSRRGLCSRAGVIEKRGG